VVWLDANAGRDRILATLRASPHREFPVGRGSIDEIEGVARKEDIYALCLDGKPFDIRSLLRQPLAVHESASVLHTLNLFKRSPVELALVVDEYGGFKGLVTRTDLLEAIAGDLPDAADEPDVRVLDDGSLSIDGSTPVYDLQERLGLRSLPEGDYATAAGMVLDLFGRIPAPGESAEWGGWNFEVAEKDGLRIARLRARRLARPPASEATSG
jgi:CBS domain containing-hemolysin-like protein